MKPKLRAWRKDIDTATANAEGAARVAVWSSPTPRPDETIADHYTVSGSLTVGGVPLELAIRLGAAGVADSIATIIGATFNVFENARPVVAQGVSTVTVEIVTLGATFDQVDGGELLVQIGTKRPRMEYS